MDTRQNTVDRNKSDTSKAIVTQRLVLGGFLFKKVPKWIRYLLWGLTAIRLIYPVF